MIDPVGGGFRWLLVTCFALLNNQQRFCGCHKMAAMQLITSAVCSSTSHYFCNISYAARLMYCNAILYIIDLYIGVVSLILLLFAREQSQRTSAVFCALWKSSLVLKMFIVYRLNECR